MQRASLPSLFRGLVLILLLASQVLATCNNADKTPCTSIVYPAAAVTTNAPGLCLNFTARAEAVSPANIARVDLFATATTGNNTNGCKLAVMTPTWGTIYSTFSWVSPPVGSFYITSKAFDSATLSTISNKRARLVTVSGTVANMAPITLFTQGGGSYAKGASVTLGTSACDLDGTIAGVDFYVNGTWFATYSSPPYVAFYTVSSPGSYVFTASARDNLGLRGPQAQATAKVTAPPGSSTTSATPTASSSSSTSSVRTSTTSSTATVTEPPKTTTPTSTLQTTTTTSTKTSTSSTIAPTSTSTATPTVTGTIAPGPYIVLTVINGVGPATFVPWTGANVIANAPPAGQVFDKWTVTAQSTPPKFDNQFSMNARISGSDYGSVTIMATYKVNTAMPLPVATHPPPIITAQDVPRLQQWASASNPMFASGFAPALAEAEAAANSKWSWSYQGGTGLPSSGWSDSGNSMFEGQPTEAYAVYFAFASLIKNDVTYAKKARDMILYVMKKYMQNKGSLPFGQASFATYDRSRWWGEAFPLTYDWVQFWPGVWTPADKQLIRSVFHEWCNLQLTAYRSPPVNIYNTPSLITVDAVNNYNSAHFRQLTLMALSMDPADDPPVSSNYSDSAVGNTIRSYIYSAIGAFLYPKYGLMEQAATVAADYGIPPTTPFVGAQSGGIEAEGTLYDESMAFVMMPLVAMHTAGWDSVALSGPQMKLINSTFWTGYVNGFLHSVLPSPLTMTGSDAWMGQIYQLQTFGDLQRTWPLQGFLDAYRWIGLYDSMVGNTARRDAVRWISVNVEQGGAPHFLSRVSNIWGNAYAMSTILHFLLFDPATASNVAAIPDPRPAMDLHFYANGVGRLLTRTNWGTWSAGNPTQSLFNYMCSWEGVDHQHGDCGHFEFFRNNEWMTKEIAGYPNNYEDVVGASCVAHNTLCIRNTAADKTLDLPMKALSGIEQVVAVHGGQWCCSTTPAGNPTTVQSNGTGYVYATSIFHNLYNKLYQWSPENNLVDVVHASRSIVWLKPDFVVIYDRATTTLNKFKRFNLQFVLQPVVETPTRLRVPTAGGQNLFINTLLPLAATLNRTVEVAPTWGYIAELETAKWHLIVEDSSVPADIRWFHVLQGADGGAAAQTTTLVSGSANNGAAGSLHGTTIGTQFAVFFPRVVDLVNGMTSCSYTLPNAVAKTVVTGLAPNAKYSLTQSNGLYTLTKDALGAVLADSAGVATY